MCKYKNVKYILGSITMLNLALSKLRSIAKKKKRNEEGYKSMSRNQNYGYLSSKTEDTVYPFLKRRIASSLKNMRLRKYIQNQRLS